jgi:hypothetical protein
MMQQRLARSLRAILAIPAVLLALAPVTGHAQDGAAVTNQDIVKMVAAGLTEQVITNAIRQAPRRHFDLSPLALIDLKRKNVPDAIIAEMQTAAAPAPSTAAAPRAPASNVGLTREQAAALIGRSPFFTTTETIVVRQALNCSPGKPAGRYDAGPGESDADYFRRMQAEILNPSIPQNRETETAALEALRAAGLIRIEPSAGCGVDRQRGALQGTVTVLTPNGINASKQWRQLDANSWEVPMSRRELVAVTGIRGDAQTAAADFSWRWMSPQPGVLGGMGVRASQAIFERYDDGWRLDTSRLRDVFYDGWGKLSAPPTYTSSAAAIGRVTANSSERAAAPQQAVQVGQTIAQVEKILGQPENIVKLGARTIYVYKATKVTFTDGKVSEQVAVP